MQFTSRKIWLINFPVMMSVLVEQLINITDALFLARVGETELGASAVAAIYYLALYMLGFGFTLGLQVVIARRNGEGKYDRTGRTFFQGLWFLTALAVLLFIGSRLAAPLLLGRLISSEEVYRAILVYLDWRTVGLLFAFPSLAFRAFFVGITHTRMLTVNALAMVSANIVLNYLLIFGFGEFRGYGIAGAAAASSFSEGLSLLLFIFHMAFRTDRKQYGIRPAFDLQLTGKVASLSIWSMLHSFISVAPWFLFFIAVEHLGKTELAAANIIRSISSLFFVIVSSFATTTGSLVSNVIGAGCSRQIIPLCRKIIKLGLLTGIPLLILALLVPEKILSIYTSNPALRQVAIPAYLIMLSNFFMALPAYVYCNVITGIGRTKTAFFFQVATITGYLLYLAMLRGMAHSSLAVYWTAELFFVLLLLFFSRSYLAFSKEYNQKR